MNDPLDPHAQRFALTPAASPALPSPGQFSGLSHISPADSGGDGGDTSGTNLLAVAWQSRWLILLGTIVGGGVAWAYLQQAVPRFTSVARIYVEQNLPEMLGGEVGLSGLSSKLNTQVELIRSTPVLATAADAPEVASLSTFASIDNRVAKIRQALVVVIGQNDDIINVSAELEDATDAGIIVNAVVDAYITKYAERRSTDIAEVLTILRDEKKARDEELEQRRAALEDFRDSHLALAVQTSGEESVVTQLFSALSSELNAAQIQLLEAKARYSRAKSMLEQPAQLPFLLELARSAHSSNNSSDLERQIQQVEQSLIVERSKWGEGYPAVKLLKESLDKLKERHEEQQVAIVKAYVDTLRQNYELTVQRRDELQKAYDQQFQLATEVGSQVAELASLEEAYQRTARLCDILDARIKEVNLSEKVGAMNVDVLEVAGPGFQTYPDRAKMLSAGLAFGAMVGFGLGWLRDFLDHRLKSIEEIASVMQLPIVGAVPLISNVRPGQRDESGKMVALQPRSVGAEAVRTLRTALHFGVAGQDAKTFVVTSPAPGDGKSTVASNLAIAMAQSSQRVLLIDADMRKPTQHQIFTTEGKVGLSSVLDGSVSAAEAIVPSGVPSLDLLPCGTRPGNPVELLNNGLFVEALRQLGEQYDRIVIDSPPVMAVADARLVSAIVDCTLLVLRAERSVRRFSVAARDELFKVGTQRLGLAVNAAPVGRPGYGYGYGYGYGAYGQSAYGYGDEDGESTTRNGHARKQKSLASAANGR